MPHAQQQQDIAHSRLLRTWASFRTRDGCVYFCVNERFEFSALLSCQSGTTGKQFLHPVILRLGGVLIRLKPLN